MLFQYLVLVTACLADITLKFSNQSPVAGKSWKWSSYVGYDGTFNEIPSLTTFQDSVSFSAYASLLNGKTSYRVRSAKLTFSRVNFAQPYYSPMKLNIHVGTDPTPAAIVDMQLDQSGYFILKGGQISCFTVPDSNTKLTFVFDVSEVKLVSGIVQENIIAARDTRITLASC